MTNWQTILSGLATAAVGLAIIYFAAVMIPSDVMDASVRGALILAGVGMVTGGAGIAAARANATSVAAHQESLDGIAAAKLQDQRNHAESTRTLQQVHAVVAEVKQDVPKVAAQVAENVVADTVKPEAQK